MGVGTTRSCGPPLQPPRGTPRPDFRTQEGITASKEGCPSKEAGGEVASSWWSGLARTSEGEWEGGRAVWTQEEMGLCTSQESRAQREQPHTCSPGGGGETKAGDMAEVHSSSCAGGFGPPTGTCLGGLEFCKCLLGTRNSPKHRLLLSWWLISQLEGTTPCSDHPVPQTVSSRTSVHWKPNRESIQKGAGRTSRKPEVTSPCTPA